MLFDPTIEIVVVGVLLGKDMFQNWEHLVVAVIGAPVVGTYPPLDTAVSELE